MNNTPTTGLPPKIIIFDAEFAELDRCNFRKRQLLGATIRIPQAGKQVDFTVSIGIDGEDQIYVETGDVVGDRRKVFYPKERGTKSRRKQSSP